MEPAYELSAAREGTEDSSLTEDQWIAWEEQLALAPTLAAKRAIVESKVGGAAPDAAFRSALCVLLEVQELLDQSTVAGNAEAASLMQRSRDILAQSECELTVMGFVRKSRRISHRRALLELEIALRAGTLTSQVNEKSLAVADAMGLQLYDAAPVHAAQTTEEYPTALDPSLISADAQIMTMVQALRNALNQATFESLLRGHLCDLSTQGREEYFAQVLRDSSPGGDQASFSTSLDLERRRWMYAVVFDAYPFEYADFPGYLDAIVEDLRLAKADMHSFGFRQAHWKLSIRHLQVMIDKHLDLVRDDEAFAYRYVFLLRAETLVDEAAELELQDNFQKLMKIAAADKCLDALKVFSGSANTIRAALLHEQLWMLRYLATPDVLKLKLLEYIKIPRLGAHYVNPAFLATAAANEVVIFSNQWRPSQYEAAVGTTTSVLRVDAISALVCDNAIAGQDDERLIKTILYILWAGNHMTAQDESDLLEYLLPEFVEKEKAECMIMSGRGDLTEWKSKLPQKGAELTEWSANTEIAFCDSNPTYFSQEDDLAIHVWTRNVKVLTVHVYEVRTVDYYARIRDELQGDISLEGLLPNFEHQIDLTHLSPWQKSRVQVDLCPDAKNRRGVFVVEVFEKGVTCRAILRKGYLRHVERVTPRGHEITILDEKGNTLTDSSVMVISVKRGGGRRPNGPRFFSPADNSSATSIIPFRQKGEWSSEGFGIVLMHDGFGHLVKTFGYLEASFQLNARMFIDSEQLRPGGIAQVIVNPTLKIGTHLLPLDLLVDTKAEVTFSGSVGGTSSIHKLTLPMEPMELGCSFEIPMDAEYVSITLSARVDVDKTPDLTEAKLSSLQRVQATDSFKVQHVHHFQATYTPHFFRRPKAGDSTSFEYFAAVLGHNGEPLPGKRLQISTSQHKVKNVPSCILQTDSNGEVKLGELPFVQSVKTSFVEAYPVQNHWSWELPNTRSFAPEEISCVVRQSVRVPIPHAYSVYAEDWLATNQICVCRVLKLHDGSAAVIEDVASSMRVAIVKNATGEALGVECTPAHAGKYRVWIRPLNLQVEVNVSSKVLDLNRSAQLVSSSKVLIEQRESRFATPSIPMMITSYEVVKSADGKTYLQVQLDGERVTSAQVWVIIKNRLNVAHKKPSLALQTRTSTQPPFSVSVLASEFLMRRKISDEYTYILSRRSLLRQSQHQPLAALLGGSSLPKPSLLQYPRVVDEGSQDDISMRDADKVTGFKTAEELEDENANRKRERRRQQVRYASHLRRARSSKSDATPGCPSLLFFAHTSSTLACSSVNPQGVAAVCLNDSALFESAPGGEVALELEIIAADVHSGRIVSRQTSLKMAEEQTLSSTLTLERDVRLPYEEALDQPAMQIEHHEVLHAGETRRLGHSTSTKFAVYDTMGSVMGLWSALCDSKTIPELMTHLKRWTALTQQEKIEFYMKHASDELNFFVYRKDPHFFQAHIKAFVQAKISKSLIDLYVLDDCDGITHRYVLPGVLNSLMTLEKLLVAERVEDDEERRAICQHVIDVIEAKASAECRLTIPLSQSFASVVSQGQARPSDDDIRRAMDAENRSREHNSDASRKSRVREMQQVLHHQQQVMYAQPQAALSAMSGVSVRDHRRRMAAQPPAAAVPCSLDSLGFAASGPADPAYSQISAGMASTAQPDEFMMAESVDVGGEDNDFGVRSINDGEFDDDNVNDDQELQEMPPDETSERWLRRQAAMKRRAQPYLLPGKVRRVQEKRSISTDGVRLESANMYWRDYAQYLMNAQDSAQLKRPFLSSFLPEALHQLPQGLIALAVLDLPFADPHSSFVRQDTSDNHIRVEAESGALLYHQSIGPAPVHKEPNSTLIIKQRIVLESTRTNCDISKLLPAREFVVSHIYSCVFSISNIGSTDLQGVKLLTQIPRGGIPVTGAGFYTKNQVLDLAAHETKAFIGKFYFPQCGSFTQYPAHAAMEGEVVAWASIDKQYTDPIVVVAKSTVVDLTSWFDVAARGSLDEVLVFIANTKSPEDLSFNAVAWRCKDQAFYTGLVLCLRKRWVFKEEVWKYAFVHSDVKGMRELCRSKSTFVKELGLGIRTSIVTIDTLFAFDQRLYVAQFDHVEFGPLLSRRAHRVSGRIESASGHQSRGDVSAGAHGEMHPRILHKESRERFHALCFTLSHRTVLTGDELLVMAYFLVLFNRIPDALQVFDRAKSTLTIDDAAGSTEGLSISAAFMDAYLDFYRDQRDTEAAFPIARANVVKHGKCISDRWRERFTRLQEVLDEYDDLHANAATSSSSSSSSPRSTVTTRQGEHKQVKLTDPEVRLDAQVHGDEIHFKSQNLGTCSVAFYRIDVELMFSSDPFNSFSVAAASKSSLMLIKPWKEMEVGLVGDAEGMLEPDGSSLTVFKLPTELASSPMLLRIRELEASRSIETAASPIELTRSFFNSKLQVVVTKQAGLIQVLHNGRPVPACYVKAYARLSGPGGQGRSSKAEFYKDGYTDVIGRFDYAATNGDMLSRVERFSLLVAHPTLGTSVVQVAPPTLAMTSSEFHDKDAHSAVLF